MTGFEDFHWLRPEWLLAIVPVLVLIALLWRSHFQSQQWHKYINAALLPTLLQGGTSQKSRALLAGIGFCWFAACFAMAGPVWQKQPMPVIQNTDALVICWDLSPSMLAKDITPSRLDRARLKIIDLLKARADGQTALIAYSGEAYTVTPLTDDIQTIINLLPALAPTTLPSVGSNPEMAFTQARDLLNQAGINKGHILILTDDITPDAMEALTGFIKNSPHQLTLWGIGTTQGAPIPLPQGGFAKNNSGAIAVAKLNEVELQQFASQVGAYYVPVVTDNSDISTLENLLTGNQTPDNTQTTDRLFDQWVEQGHWLIWLCLPLLALGFRRGWLLVAIIAMPQVLLPKVADANPLDNAFSTPDQTGSKAYQSQQYEAAAKAFEQPAWQGAAQYRNGNYAEAAKAFAKDPSAQGAYNQGNAELLQNNLDAAIKAYQDALTKQPDLADAKKNLQLAEAMKKQQEQQKNQDNKDKDQKKDDQNQDKQDQQQDDKDQQKSDDSKEQQQKDQEQKDQEQKDQQQNDQRQDDKKEQQADAASSQASNSSANAQGHEQSSAGQASSQAAEHANMASSSSAQADEQTAAALAKQSEVPPQTEEQQMLEQALRKVPDDPAGLLREKFRYQYRERQQSLRSGGNYDQSEQAEQRW